MKTKEANLKRFARTATLTNFIKKTDAKWNHQEWVELCEKISEKYAPIDFDQVGLILEERRRKYLQK
jgi:hypothetical protein